MTGPERQGLESIDPTVRAVEEENASRISITGPSIKNYLSYVAIFTVITFGSATLAALAEAESHDNQAHDELKGKTEQTTPQTTPTAVAPAGKPWTFSDIVNTLLTLYY